MVGKVKVEGGGEDGREGEDGGRRGRRWGR